MKQLIYPKSKVPLCILAGMMMLLPTLLYARNMGDVARERPAPVLMGKGFAVMQDEYRLVKIIVTEKEVEGEGVGRLRGMLFLEGEKYSLDVEKTGDGEFSGKVLLQKEGREEVGDISLQVKEVGEKRQEKVITGKLVLEGESYRLYLLSPGRRGEGKRRMRKGGECYE